MIEKIRGLIEDNTNLDVTRNQVILALCVIGGIILLVVSFLFASSTGPQADDPTVKPAPVDYSSGDYTQE
ncbi:MAG: hypothetical protein CR972_00205 [Candidatus Moraniibacteriota bacterium]|nr:MAG: hypothetical protein CR972_00205 [Candidatus Moranbacteria bacterium]